MNGDTNLSTTPETDKTKDLSEFIERNQNYYLPVFAKFEATNQKLSWNWPAFLFMEWWAGYRKQYWLFVVVLPVEICIGYLPEPFDIISRLCIMIFFGALGNYLYYRHAVHVLSRFTSLDEDKRQRKIIKLGGTSTIIFIIIPILLVLGLVLLQLGYM